MLLATVGRDQYFKVYDVINFGAAERTAAMSRCLTAG